MSSRTQPSSAPPSGRPIADTTRAPRQTPSTRSSSSSSRGGWDPSRHPRAAAGAAGGGRFITGQSNPQKDDAAKGAQKKLGGQLSNQRIRSFQRAHGLVVDGVIGRQTAAALLGSKGASKLKVGALTTKQAHGLAQFAGVKTQAVSGTAGKVRVHSVSSTQPATAKVKAAHQPRRVTVNGVHAGYISNQPPRVQDAGGRHQAEVGFLAHDHTGEPVSQHHTIKSAARAVARNHRAVGSPGELITSVSQPTIARGGLTSSQVKQRSRAGSSQPTITGGSVG